MIWTLKGTIKTIHCFQKELSPNALVSSYVTVHIHCLQFMVRLPYPTLLQKIMGVPGTLG